MSTDKYYFFKLSARDIPSRTHILICMTIHEPIFKIDRFDLIVSQNSETSSLGVNDSYRDCMNKIQKLTLSGQFSQSSTISLTNAYNNQFTNDSFMEEFSHYIENKDTVKLKTLFEQSIHKVLGRAEYDYVCFIDNVTQEELDGTAVTSIQEETKKSPYPSIPDGASILNYQFVLSPVGGTIATDLRIGDKVLIKINKDTPAGSSAIQSMKLSAENGQIIPCPAEIVDIIKKEKNALLFVANISENLYGLYTEEESGVKVKMAELSTVAKEEKIIRDKANKTEGSLLIPGIVAVMVLLIVWVIAYFLL
jgi:anionic cell wall polymer biosynthesis LytR-Cps2A-Psr (LCP) family protein